MKRILLVILCFGAIYNCIAQNAYGKLFGVYQDLNHHFRLMNVDTNTAAITNIDSLPGTDNYFTTSSALDRVNGIYYLGITDTAGDSRLAQIDISTGAVLSKPLLDWTMTSGLLELQYHHGKQKLYGVNLQTGNDNANVVEVNPANGNFTLIKTINPVATKVNGSGTIDEIGNRFFFNGNDGNNGSFADRLYVVDLDSGTVLSQHVYALSITFPPFELQYDPVQDRLFGLYRDDNATYHLAKISPNTALLTSVSTITGMAGVFSGTSTFDPIGRRYFFTGFDDNNKDRLYVIDVESGDVISDAEIPAVTSTFSMKLEYDYEGVSAVNELQIKPLSVYPNPAADKIWFNIPFEKECDVQLVDMLGKEVYTTVLKRTGINYINVNFLPNGIYNLRTGEKGVVYSGKVIISR